jgi:hypothetical protein
MGDAGDGDAGGGGVGDGPEGGGVGGTGGSTTAGEEGNSSSSIGIGPVSLLTGLMTMGVSSLAGKAAASIGASIADHAMDNDNVASIDVGGNPNSSTTSPGPGASVNGSGGGRSLLADSGPSDEESKKRLFGSV